MYTKISDWIKEFPEEDTNKKILSVINKNNQRLAQKQIDETKKKIDELNAKLNELQAIVDEAKNPDALAPFTFGKKRGGGRKKKS